MGATRESLVQLRTVVGIGEEELKLRRGRVPAFRYDHIDAVGVRASTWRNDDGIVRYEQAGCVLVAVTGEEAAASDPGPGST